MDARIIEKRFQALGTESRIEILRLLSKAGKAGLPSGEVARRLHAVQNTLSTQLNLLEGVGLVQRQREGRNIIYSINPNAVVDLIQFLVKDCGGGRIKSTTKVLA